MSENIPRVALGDAVTLSDYQSWKHHPVSKVFFRYLRDYAAMAEKDTIERWKLKSTLLADEGEVRGRILTLHELVDLEFGSMVEFYQGSEAAQGNGPQDHQD